MDRAKKDDAEDLNCLDLQKRELVIAYLSYALDDVRKLGGVVGLQLLQMTIAAITENSVGDSSSRPSQSDISH